MDDLTRAENKSKDSAFRGSRIKCDGTKLKRKQIEIRKII